MCSESTEFVTDLVEYCVRRALSSSSKEKISYLTHRDCSLSLRTDEHVGDTAQPPSGQTVQELVDSFSGQLPGRICAKGKSTAGVLVEEKDLVSYRRAWEKSWGDKCGSF